MAGSHRMLQSSGEQRVEARVREDLTDARQFVGILRDALAFKKNVLVAAHFDFMDRDFVAKHHLSRLREEAK